MNELEILKELINYEYKARDLEMRIQIWHDEDEKAKFMVELEHINLKIEKLINQLIKIEDKRYSSQAKSAMIDQLNLYIKEINKAKSWLNLSRNQGMIIENELFSEIVRDLNGLLIDKITGIHIPAYLKYTVDSEDSVSIPELTEFLRKEVLNLRKIDNPNYINLRKFRDGFVERIVEQFIEKNLKN